MTASALNVPSLKNKVSPEEWTARVDLAAAYRLLALYKWGDPVFTPLSLRVPDAQEVFLINPYGLLTVGETVADAWVAMYYLEASCAIQVRAQAGGELIPVPKAVLDQAVSRQRQGGRVWPGLIRRLDRLDPSYKN